MSATVADPSLAESVDHLLATHYDFDCWMGFPCIRLLFCTERQVLGVLWHENVHHAIAKLVSRGTPLFDEVLYHSIVEIEDSEESAIAYMALARLPR